MAYLQDATSLSEPEISSRWSAEQIGLQFYLRRKAAFKDMELQAKATAGFLGQIFSKVF